MKIEIKSDYLDCYDHWFDLGGDIIFQRSALSSWNLSRQDMFKAFGKIGLKAPKFDRLESFSSDEIVVIYTDNLAHCGEGKILSRVDRALTLGFEKLSWLSKNGINDITNIEVPSILGFGSFSSKAPKKENSEPIFASRYIADFPRLTYRYLSCGGYGVWFRHESLEDWRSNVGDGFLAETEKTEAQFPVDFVKHVLNPVWAIDFVAQKSNGKVELLAIDFNTAPKIAGTPLSKLVDAKKLHAGLAKIVEKLGPTNNRFQLNRHGVRSPVFDNNIVLLTDV